VKRSTASAGFGIFRCFVVVVVVEVEVAMWRRP
jgi:hypothetical protein